MSVEGRRPLDPRPSTLDTRHPSLVTPHMIKGLIFDCDGTLADTMPLHWRAWQVVTCRYGIDFPEERFYALGGVPPRDILTMLCKEQTLSLDALVVAKEKEEEYLKLMAQAGPIHEVVAIARDHAGK